MYGYIYETKNLVNGKKYIGQHKSKKFDNWYLGSGVVFKQAIKKYGKENFCTRIIEKIETNKDDLNDREKYWIEYYDAVKSKEYYNNSCGGEEKKWQGFNRAIKLGLKEHHCKKRKLSQETKEKISKANKGKKRTEEQRRQFSEAHKGKPAWNKGKKTPVEIREKLSKAHKGQKAWNKGKSFSVESRKRMSLSKTGTKYINKNGIVKSVKKQDLELYLKEGWKLGRKNVKR